MKELPFPVNNGVTVAVAGNLLALSKRHSIFVYNYSDNRFYTYTNNGLEETVFKSTRFDVVICSPILSLKHYLKYGKQKINASKTVALINDVYAYVLLKQSLLSIKTGFISVSDIKSLAKVVPVYVMENILLRKSDLVVVQTAVEVSILERAYFKDYKILDLPNACQFSCDVNEISVKRGTSIGLVASFNDTYMKVVKRFVTKVWIKCVSKNSDLKLHVLGKNSKRVAEYVNEYYPEFSDSIIVESYYEDIKDFYLKMHTIVCPIYKGFGLINKTVESMLCGCITVGDSAAFNGIKGFESGVHGFIASDDEHFINLILESQFFNRDEVGKSANEIINRSFSWDSNAERLESYL